MSDTSQIRRRWDLDDATVEAIVQGRPVAADLEPLVAFARQVRIAAVDLPGPAPSDELARILRGDDNVTIQGRDSVQIGRVAAAMGRVADLGVAAKIALGASVAAASIAGAGAVGVLPAAADNAVRDAIEAVTPVDFGHDNEQPDGYGKAVSKDATGENDGENGVDGQKIAEDAPGAEHRPDSGKPNGDGSGKPDSTGLTRANETPADPHAPDTVPGCGKPEDEREPGDCKPETPDAPASTVPARPDQANAGN